MALRNTDWTPPTQASWLDNNQPNYHEFSLTQFYNKLFSLTRSNLHELLQRRILDVVGSDMAALQRRLGQADGQRLAEHAQSIRDIETNLQNMAGMRCAPPPAVSDLPQPYTHEPLQERNRLFADMLTVALSCDLTRVFTVQFTGRENDAILWQVGATAGTHALSHNGDQASMDTLNRAFQFTMGELSYLLQKLKATPEGAGNLLDSCCIYITSCIGNPTIHSCDRDLLQMIAGRAGGALHTGQHYSATNELATAVPLTALRAVGLDSSSFGGDSMRTTQPIAALLARP